MTKVITDGGFLATLKVMVPRAAEGEELAVGSLKAVLEQAMMDRSQFDGLAEPQEVPSALGLRITPELRARIQDLPSSGGGDS